MSPVTQRLIWSAVLTVICAASLSEDSEITVGETLLAFFFAALAMTMLQIRLD
jgi:hypothetical protein